MPKPLPDIYTNVGDHVDLLREHFDNINEFLRSDEAFALFPPPKVVRHNDWGDIEQKIVEKYGPTHRMYGKCFHSAKFVYFFGGGKKYFDLKLIRPFEFCSLGFKTTHWFVRHKTTREIFDPTGDQFIYPGYEYGKDQHMIDRWETAKNGEFGNPYFKRGGTRFDEVVPNKVVMALGKLYKSKYGTNGGIDWWLNAEDMVVEKPADLKQFIS